MESIGLLDNKRHVFDALCAEVAGCRRCPTMEGRRRVLSPANGSPGALVMFVAEAPGRLGGDRTGAPLYGDRTGERFDRLLAAAGWRRSDVFITNAVLCNPRSDNGRVNRRPSRAEVANCADHLRRQIELVDPRLVVALGAVALGALGRVEPHHLVLARDYGLLRRWYGRWLAPLSHPSDRALWRRSEAEQVADMRALSGFVQRLASASHVNGESDERR